MILSKSRSHSSDSDFHSPQSSQSSPSSSSSPPPSSSPSPSPSSSSPLHQNQKRSPILHTDKPKYTIRAPVTSFSDHYTKHGRQNLYHGGIWLSIRRRVTRLIHHVMRSRRHRYFTMMGLALVGFLTLQFMIMWFKRRGADLIIEKESYDPVKYLDLDPNVNSNLPQGTTIYHITREFGKSTRTNLGRHVTALANTQSADSSLSVNVVMPYYSFLKNLYRSSSYCQLSIRIRDEYGRWRSVKFPVHRFWLKNTEAPEVRTSVKPNEQDLVSVFMIGQATKIPPYNSVFKANNVSAIYSSRNSELKDLYFCKAAAELITYLNTVTDVPLFSKTETRGVDVVHIHGSINALTVEFIKEFHKDNKPQKTPPSIIYTLHDQHDEQLYHLKPEYVNKFMDVERFRANNLGYFYQDRLFTSSFGIDESHITTFASREGAQYIVERIPDFNMKELIMPSVLRKAKNGQWVGISKELDSVTLDPFHSAMLLESNSNFPDNIYTFDVELFYAEIAESMELQPLVRTAKMSAKEYLIREGILETSDLNRPLILFTDDFRHPNGFQFFDCIAGIMKEQDAKIMIVTLTDDMPWDEGEAGVDIEELAEKYPDEVVVFYDEQSLMDWEILFRAAADIQFIPSFKEQYEVANVAEGFLFGNVVVGSVLEDFKGYFTNGTLEEVTKSSNDEHDVNNGLNDDGRALEDEFSSYFLFDFDPNDLKSTIGSLKLNFKLAIENWRGLETDVRKRELFMRELIKDAIKSSQDLESSGTERYRKVYKMAMLQTNDELEEELLAQ